MGESDNQLLLQLAAQVFEQRHGHVFTKSPAIDVLVPKDSPPMTVWNRTWVVQKVQL